MSELSEACYEALIAASLPEAEAEALARELLSKPGAESCSNKYRSVRHLPEGETALQAVTRLDPVKAARLAADAARWLEDRAKDYYYHQHAREEGNTHELDLRTFKAFKRLEHAREGSEAKANAAAVDAWTERCARR